MSRYKLIPPTSFVENMAAGASALNFALILSGILLRLTPERAPRTVLRDERSENLGFYACMVTTNVGSFNLLNFFSRH
jgi:hypothetical protein